VRRRPVASTTTVLLAGGAIAVASACRDPTEITLVLRTDVPCSEYKGVAIAVGVGPEVETDAPQTSAAECPAQNGDLGTIVLTPSGNNDDAVNIKVTVGDGRSPETCTPSDSKGCIVERRKLAYIPHTPLRLIVALLRVCDGVACNAEQTCDPATAQCVSSFVDSQQCEGAGCDRLELGDASVDGGQPEASDGALVLDGPIALDASSGPDAAATVDGALGAVCLTSSQCENKCCCWYMGGSGTCEVGSICASEGPGCSLP
jgi:hypothetical protein